ncbi:MAG: alkaline phosphatase family protein [Nitrososphaerales archaeon]
MNDEYADGILKELRKGKKKQNFLRPNYSKYSLPNLSATIMNHFLGKRSDAIDDESIKKVFEGSETIILILVDGLGYNFMKRSLNGRDSNIIRAFVDSGLTIPITSTFPTTTTTALTSVNTALTPQEHGIVGHTMFLKEFGTVANMITFTPAIEPISGGLVRAGLVPENYLGSHTIYESLASAGIESTVLTRSIYRNSILSRILHKGASIIPYVNSADLFISLAEQVRAKVPLIFCYWDELDTGSHIYGPETDKAQAIFRNFLFSFYTEFIRKLNRTESRNTSVLMTGDHGLVSVDRNESIIANEYPSLMKNLQRPPSGDSRASFLKVMAGREDKVLRFFEKFAGKLGIFRSDELFDDGFFGRGRVREGVREAIGEFTVLSKNGVTFRYRYKKTRDETVLRGHHGGLTEEELFVPLIALKPASFKIK